MDFAGDDVFSDAALSADEAVEVGARGLLNEPAQLLHGGADADEEWSVWWERFFGAPCVQGPAFEGAADDAADFGEAEGFEEEIGGAAPETFDDGLGRRIDGDADDAGGVGTLNEGGQGVEGEAGFGEDFEEDGANGVLVGKP